MRFNELTEKQQIFLVEFYRDQLEEFFEGNQLEFTKLIRLFAEEEEYVVEQDGSICII